VSTGASIPDALPQGTQSLPSLREDLRLLPSRSAVNGAPQWVLFDPLAHAYFQLDLEAFQVVSCWFDSTTIDDLRAKVARRHGREPSQSEIKDMLRFIATHKFSEEPAGGWRRLAEEKSGQSASPFKALLHNYLFFKLPLVRPHAFLQRTLPAARTLASPAVLLIVAGLGLAGLLLVSRRWGAFIGTFNDFWTPAGAAFFAAALLVLKLFHELSHAYAAAARGCHVSSMGIAVMLGAPMPYTDVTDAWKLARRQDRMAIDLAGVSVELAIAALATFAWVFLPDGPMRGVAFVFATTGWVMSLAVNLNPFMRFDGYFVLADLINVPNLQARAFVLAKWRLRQWLFGMHDPCPDSLEGSLRSAVAAYGFATWLYRLVLFTGIALVVYHMFFKILGIALFLIEIVVFIALPIWREMRHWWSERKHISTAPRTLLTGAALVGLVALACVPWSGTVIVPAVLEPQIFARIYPRTGGEITALHVKVGDKVSAGDRILELDQPHLRKELNLVRIRIATLHERLDRRVADRKELSATPQLEQELAALAEKAGALGREMESLIIRAPVAGVLREVNPSLHAGRSLARDEEIGVILTPSGLAARGYVPQSELWRLSNGQDGLFYPDDIKVSPIQVTLREASPVGAQTIEIPVLSSVNGGKVETWPPSKSGELTPLNASHLVQMDVTGSIGVVPEQVLRGTVRLQGVPQSFAARVWRHLLKVVVQESGI
jgi:putative peptide zinc metalloprotease protein